MSKSFNPGDKVIKRNEKDFRKWGKVMDRENTPMFQKTGYIAVYFKRQVWIKPENIMHYSEWQAKHQPQSTSIKDFWVQK